MIGGTEVDGDLGDVVASMSQPRNRLENRGGENDEMSREVWKAVETSTGEVRMGETKGGRNKRRSRRKRIRKTVEIKKVAEEWEIWDEEEEAARSEAEAKKMVPKKFHQWIKVFRKKQSERMSTKKV